MNDLFSLTPWVSKLPEVGDAVESEARRLDNRLQFLRSELKKLDEERQDFLRDSVYSNWSKDEIWTAKH